MDAINIGDIVRRKAEYRFMGEANLLVCSVADGWAHCVFPSGVDEVVPLDRLELVDAEGAPNPEPPKRERPWWF